MQAPKFTEFSARWSRKKEVSEHRYDQNDVPQNQSPETKESKSLNVESEELIALIYAGST